MTRDYHAEKARLHAQISYALIGLMIFEGSLLVGSLGLLALHGLGVI